MSAWGGIIGNRPWIGLLVGLVLVVAFAPGLMLIEMDSSGFALTTTIAWADKTTLEAQAPTFVSKIADSNWLATSESNILTEVVLTQLFAVHQAVLYDIRSGSNSFQEVCYRPTATSSCSQSNLFEAYNVTSASQIPIIFSNLADLPKAMFGGATTADNGTLIAATSLIFSYTVDTDIDASKDWEKSYIDYFAANASVVVASSSGGINSITYINPVGADDELTKIVFGEIPIMIGSVVLILLYMAISLFRFNAVKSRVLLGLSSIITVILSMACSIGVISYAGLPFSFIGILVGFVLLGLGADNVMVLLDTLEHIDPTLPISERMAQLGDRACTAISITTMTSAIAFLVTSSVHIPVIHTFCILAALAVAFEWCFKMTLYLAMITFDERRVQSSRADCLPCIRVAPKPSPEPRGKAAVAAQADAGSETCAPQPPVLVNAAAAAPVAAASSSSSWTKTQQPRALSEWSGIAVVRVLLSRGLFSVLKHRVARWAVMVGTVVLAGVCLYSATKLSSDANSVEIYPDNSYIRAFYTTVSDYYNTSRTNAEVVTFQLPYQNPQVQAQLLSMQDEVLALPNVHQPSTFWLPSFLLYQQQLRGGSPAAAPQTAAQFCEELRQFLTLPTWTPAAAVGAAAVAETIDVAMLSGDVVLSAEPLADGGCITSARSWVSYGTDAQVSIATDNLAAIRNITDTYADMLQPSVSPTVTVQIIPYMEGFTYDDTNADMLNTVIVDLALGLLGVFAAMCVWMNPLLAAFIALMVLSIDVMLFGLLNVWGLKVSIGSFISQIIALGLAVDYTVYLSVAFVNSNGKALERLFIAYDQMGVAVLSGGLSFFLGVVLLSLAKSSAFRDFFKVMLGTTIFGILHGLLVAPAALTEAYAFADWQHERRTRQQQQNQKLPEQELQQGQQKHPLAKQELEQPQP